MSKLMRSTGRVAALTVAISSLALADVTAGFISYDVSIPTSTSAFDISNETGPNSTVFPDTTFPVVTPVSLTNLALTVNFSDGSTQNFGSSYFTLSPLDGLSFDGRTLPIGGSNPQPTKAVLTGMFATTHITLNDGSSLTINPSFSATILPSTGSLLSDGDLALILATPATSAVPEPSFSWVLGAGLFALVLVPVRKRLRKSASTIAVIAACLVILLPAAHAQVKLNTGTTPSTGVAGVSFVNLIGSGFPLGHGTLPPANATLSFSLSCGGTVAATANPDTIKLIVGSSDRLHVLLPAVLTTATYFVSVTGTTSDGTSYSSTNCSQVAVTHTNPTLSACVPTSSLGIVAPVKGPAPVKALVPNGCWDCGTTGIQVVQLEAGGGPPQPPVSVPTGSSVNSCAGNPATGEGVCVANDNNVYHLSPSNSVTNLKSASNRTTGFSGGTCENCGVAVNALTNQAVIAMGLTAAPSGTALQNLDLGSDTFETPFPLSVGLSEDISIDPTRGFILNPTEGSNYDLLQFNSTSGAITGEFGHSFSPSQVFDSAAEDCTTGIALASSEFTNNVYLADLTQASFVSGTPGSWSSAQNLVTLNTSFSAGSSGITVAPGTSHLATMTGEFGGSSFAVLQLPATSGTGTPSIVDYAFVPCISGFSAGLDPSYGQRIHQPERREGLHGIRQQPAALGADRC